VTETPADRLIAAVIALKPDLNWAMQEANSMRGDLVWLAVCGVDLDYADALRRIEALERANRRPPDRAREPRSLVAFRRIAAHPVRLQAIFVEPRALPIRLVECQLKQPRHVPDLVHRPGLHQQFGALCWRHGARLHCGQHARLEAR
jgi:hypothetical protein